MKKVHRIAVGLWFLFFVALAGAQEPAPTNTGKDITAEYQRETKRLVGEHWATLAEIEAEFRKAHKEYSEENVRRSIALGEENRATYAELAKSDLKGAERDARAQQIEGERKEKSKAYAEWRDSTYLALMEERNAKRKAQFDKHNAELESLRSQYQSQLARLRATAGNLSAPVFKSSGDESSEQPELIPERPASPEPTVEEPNVDGLPAGPVEAQVHTETHAQVNTQVAPEEFDIALYAIEGIKFEDLRLHDGDVRAHELIVILILANRGSATYAFDGNRIDVAIEEGYRDPSGGAQRLSEEPLTARAEYDLTIPADHGIQVWVPVRYRNPGGAWRELRDRTRRFFREGIRGTRLRTGDRPVVIKPNLWYTVDLRLETPREYDNDSENHGAYMHVRFDDEGSIVEQEGPFFFDPPSVGTAEQKF